MGIKPLSERRRALEELRDRHGNPLDQRKLAHEKFLSSPNASSTTTLLKARMDHADRSVDRELLAKACEQMADLMAQLRPSLSKASARNSSRTREMELLAAARKLRGKGFNQK
jgi:hypothetical protein